MSWLLLLACVVSLIICLLTITLTNFHKHIKKVWLGFMRESICLCRLVLIFGRWTLETSTQFSNCVIQLVWILHINDTTETNQNEELPYI